MLWRDWFYAFNGVRVPDPRGTVRCWTKTANILGVVRAVDGRLVIGFGRSRGRFDSFCLLLTSHPRDAVARQASDGPPCPLCPRHPDDRWEQQRSKILRQAHNKVEGPRFVAEV